MRSDSLPVVTVIALIKDSIFVSLYIIFISHLVPFQRRIISGLNIAVVQLIIINKVYKTGRVFWATICKSDREFLQLIEFDVM